jgi:hypothetical protein
MLGAQRLVKDRHERIVDKSISVADNAQVASAPLAAEEPW